MLIKKIFICLVIIILIIIFVIIILIPITIDQSKSSHKFFYEETNKYKANNSHIEAVNFYSRKDEIIYLAELSKDVYSIPDLVSEPCAPHNKFPSTIKCKLHKTGKYYNDPETGLAVYIQEDKEKLLIVFAGTEFFTKHMLSYLLTIDFHDIYTDIVQNLGIVLPQQYEEALKIVAIIKSENPSKRLIVTGHSLGGGLANYAGTINKIEVVAFNSARLSDEVGSHIAKELTGQESTSNLATAKTNTMQIRFQNDKVSAISGPHLFSVLPGVQYIIKSDYSYWPNHSMDLIIENLKNITSPEEVEHMLFGKTYMN